MTRALQRLAGIAETSARLPGAAPVVQRIYRAYFNAAAGHARLFCGIYPDFAAAARAIPAGRLLGYDNAASAERMLPEWLDVHPSDYPVMFWLEKLLRECRSVFDWGGNVGIKYFAFRPYLTFPEDLRWCVNDVPAVLRRGEEIARREGAPALHFSAGLDELARADVLLASGVVQFVDDPFARLRAASALPAHLIFNKVPAYDMPSAVTLHNMGTALCPYHLFERNAFVAAIEALGFELRDEWRSPGVSARIPFSPQHRIAAYSGFYFAATGSRRAPSRETAMSCAI